jgi:transposase
VKKIGRKKVYRYTDEYRYRVLESILAGGLGVYEAARRYGVGVQSIYRWLDQMEKGNSRMRDKKKGDKEKLEERLKALEEELRLERLRSQAYKEMIRQAEAHFNIAIEKKSGPKQSKK